MRMASTHKLLHWPTPPLMGCPLQAGTPDAAVPLLSAAYEALSQVKLEGSLVLYRCDKGELHAHSLRWRDVRFSSSVSAVCRSRPSRPHARCSWTWGPTRQGTWAPWQPRRRQWELWWVAIKQSREVLPLAMHTSPAVAQTAACCLTCSAAQVLVLLAWCYVESGEGEQALSCLQVGAGCTAAACRRLRHTLS